MDIDTAGRLFPAIAGVGIALAAFALVLWLIKNRKTKIFAFPGSPSQKRLAVVETVALDVKRRLFLVRRDNVEYLILTGGPTDVVLETHTISGALQTGQPAQIPPSAHAPYAPQQAPYVPEQPGNFQHREPTDNNPHRQPVRPNPQPVRPQTAREDDYAYGPEAAALGRDYEDDDRTYQSSYATAPPAPQLRERTPEPTASPSAMNRETAESILEAARQRILRDAAVQPRQSRAPTTAANQRESAFSRVLDGKPQAGDLPTAQTPHVQPHKSWSPPPRQTSAVTSASRATAAATQSHIEDDSAELEEKVKLILEELNRRAR